MSDFAPPFPALTSGQRLHLEVFGYVVIEKAISDALVRRLRETTYALEAKIKSGMALPAPATVPEHRRELFRIDNIVHLDASYLEYLTHPRIVGFAEEAIGTEARLEQSDVHVRRPLPEDGAERHGFHRGAHAHFTWQSSQGGLYQCHFVKALTNLTDLGPDDGGTRVIAGSHKLAHLPPADIINAALESPQPIHSVVAPAGSTLLFYETTIHAAGIIKSGKDRMLIVGGYASSMCQNWHGFDIDPAFVETLPEHLRPVLTGSKRFLGEPRDRKLGAPAASS